MELGNQRETIEENREKSATGEEEDEEKKNGKFLFSKINFKNQKD